MFKFGVWLFELCFIGSLIVAVGSAIVFAIRPELLFMVLFAIGFAQHGGAAIG